MMQHHNYSLTELNMMLPWEREVYVQLLLQHLKDEEARHKAEEAKMKSGAR